MKVIGQGLGYNPIRKEPYHVAIQIEFNPSDITPDIDVNA